MSNFIEKCHACEVLFDDIDDFIDQWHEKPGKKSLYDFLGMTRYEYSLWISDSTILPTIVNAHAQNRSIDDLLEEFQSQIPIAARSTGPRKTQELVDWLKEKNLWS